MIEELLEEIYSEYPELPHELFELARKAYSNDQRSKEEIKKEIYEQIKKYIMLERQISMPIDEDILSNSIIIIGPMGTGKSTISEKLHKKTGLPKVSLDDRKLLNNLYSERKKFRHLKDFEFYLTTEVLSNLKERTIIDFGAGHSIYENPLMFIEMKKFLSRFSNVVFLIPSQDKELSLEICNQRIKNDRSVGSGELNDNKHFIYSQYNEELATIIEYTYGKSPDEICNNIIAEIEEKQKQSHQL